MGKYDTEGEMKHMSVLENCEESEEEKRRCELDAALLRRIGSIKRELGLRSDEEVMEFERVLDLGRNAWDRYEDVCLKYYDESILGVQKSDMWTDVLCVRVTLWLRNGRMVDSYRKLTRREKSVWRDNCEKSYYGSFGRDLPKDKVVGYEV